MVDKIYYPKHSAPARNLSSSMWLYLIWIILSQIPASSCIWCYQCFTSDPKGACITNPSWPNEECLEVSCLKTVIYNPNGTLMSLSRSCTSIDMPSYCSIGQLTDEVDPDTRSFQADKKHDVKICTFFCGSNYCNAATMPGYGIRCYKCDSTLDVGCQELFQEETSGIEPIECAEDVYQGRYCIKTTGMYGGKPGTRRFCSSKNLGNMCNYIQRPNDPMEFRACIYTCSGDLCNSSNYNIGSFFFFFFIAIFAIFLAAF